MSSSSTSTSAAVAASSVPSICPKTSTASTVMPAGPPTYASRPGGRPLVEHGADPLDHGRDRVDVVGGERDRGDGRRPVPRHLERRRRQRLGEPRRAQLVEVAADRGAVGLAQARVPPVDEQRRDRPPVGEAVPQRLERPGRLGARRQEIGRVVLRRVLQLRLVGPERRRGREPDGEHDPLRAASRGQRPQAFEHPPHSRQELDEGAGRGAREVSAPLDLGPVRFPRAREEADPRSGHSRAWPHARS